MHSEKWVTFREEKTKIQEMDRIAESLGIDRSALIRLTMREKMRSCADSGVPK